MRDRVPRIVRNVIGQAALLGVILLGGCTWDWPAYSECGNGVADPGETCDGSDFAGGGSQCSDVTVYAHGVVRCADDCRLDTSDCHQCGNGSVEGPEPCDGSNLEGQTCQGLGFDEGTLACREDCLELDWSACVGCGDGLLRTGEVCDDGNFAPGDGCDDECQVEPGWTCDGAEPTVCHTTCSDGIAAGEEVCDGGDLRGQTCQGLGFSGGDLACEPGCLGFDTSSCAGPGCGNGVAEDGEVCDGADLKGETCAGQGFSGGDLGCLPGCQGVDTSRCWTCGDGVCSVDGHETVAGCAADCGWAQLSSGWNHTCAVKRDGSAWCWGSNGNGQLGTGSTGGPHCGGDCSAVPVRVALSGPVRQVSAGNDYACAVKEDETVWCWGSNWYGVLGIGSTDGSAVPVQVSGLTGIQEVSAGVYHACARNGTGALWCWGDNGHGALGDGSTTMQTSPVQVQALSDASALSAGYSFTCALRGDRTAWCWGLNCLGSLGNGTTADSGVPVQVSGLSDVTSITAGGDCVGCASREDGTAWCWGANTNGKLGIGTSEGPETCGGYPCSRSPVQLTTLTDVAAVSPGGGSMHLCTRAAGGTAWCWGWGQTCELGDGDCSDETSPVQVMNLTAVEAISVSFSATCAVESTGVAWCWGGNPSGQLGLGTDGEDVPLPARVLDP